MEVRGRETMVVAKQLHDRCSLDVIGNLYFREDILDRVRTVPTRRQARYRAYCDRLYVR